MAEETRNSENTTAESTTTKEETVKKENIIWKLSKYMIKGTGYLYTLFLLRSIWYAMKLWKIFPFYGGFEYMLAYVLYLYHTGITGTTSDIAVGVHSLLILLLRKPL